MSKKMEYQRLRQELDEVRQELAGLKAERAYDAAPAALADTPARRDKRARHNAAYGAPAALAGDALREALAEAIDRALVGDPAEVPTEDIVAAVMPIVGRAVLAARDAFQAPPVHVPPLPTGLVYRMKAPEPARELRIYRVTPGPASLRDVHFQGQCSHCLWTMHSVSQGKIEYMFEGHECALYPAADYEIEDAPDTCACCARGVVRAIEHTPDLMCKACDHQVIVHHTVTGNERDQ